MRLRECFLTQNDCYKRAGSIVPKGVMVHSTGANNPTLRRYVQPDDGKLGVNTNGNSWNRPGVGACVHAFIGKLKDGSVATYQTLPWTMRGWHCARSGNDTHISFEICEDGLTDRAYFDAVYREAVELTAYLCSAYALDPLTPGAVVDHAEGYGLGIASNHADVSHWLPRFGRSMDTFRAEVAREMQPEDNYEEAEMRYVTLQEVPQWYRPTLDKLIADGSLSGRGGEGENLVVDLSEDSCRVLTMLDRRGLFDVGK